MSSILNEPIVRVGSLTPVQYRSDSMISAPSFFHLYKSVPGPMAETDSDTRAW